ncbi:hypothetical protein [Streptomyces sp. NPDC020965]|uniref:hypothetical protein n=1 Tax=Streptomyces sp. NPDC020965 TaxID=3365105 RepID=UPI0037A99191
MTTMPGLLPLARHYYEARREVLLAGGRQATPWYLLSSDEHAVAIAEAKIVVEAIRRVDEERAVLLGGADRALPTAGDAAVA